MARMPPCPPVPSSPRATALRWLALAWVCSAANAWAQPQSFVVLEPGGQPAAMAVVAVMVKGAPPHAPAGVVVEMAQRQRQFTPSVIAIQAGTAVNFPNFDTVRHHVYSFSPTRRFEIKLYAGTPTAPVLFDKPGTATLGCNIHDTMIGHIHVVETPYFGLTDAAGRLVLDLPAGEHAVRIWHRRMGESTPPMVAHLRVGPPLSVRLAP